TVVVSGTLDDSVRFCVADPCCSRMESPGTSLSTIINLVEQSFSTVCRRLDMSLQALAMVGRLVDDSKLVQSYRPRLVRPSVFLHCTGRMDAANASKLKPQLHLTRAARLRKTSGVVNRPLRCDTRQTLKWRAHCLPCT